jgi:hypothetical protein
MGIATLHRKIRPGVAVRSCNGRRPPPGVHHHHERAMTAAAGGCHLQETGGGGKIGDFRKIIGR